MKTRMHTDTWISRVAVVLGLILAASVVGILILVVTNQALPQILIALGVVATGGLIRLWISPLNQKLLE